MKLIALLLDRHNDGTRHEWGPRTEPTTHACTPLAYCHHWQQTCHCGQVRIGGHVVEEVR